MFNEILRIKPVLDSASARQMEESLAQRFSRVAQRFGQGLKNVVKGSVLGISLGLLSKLLNPIEALEDKIKGLLGQGTDLRDLADRFNTSGGQIKQLADVAQSVGVSPDQFKDLLLKYAQGIEKAREELNNPFAERSASTVALKQFTGEADLVKGFTQFMTSLKAAGNGAGTDEALSERAKRLMTEAQAKGTQLDPSVREDLLQKGELRVRSALETRRAVEKDVFGEAQFGAARKFLDSDVNAVSKSIKEPPVGVLNAAVEKASTLADKKRALDVQNQTEDFVAATNKLNGSMVEQMAAAEKLQNERETKQLDSFNDLKKASIAIEQVQGLLTQGNTIISKGIGYLADLANFIGTLKNSRMFRGMFSGGKE